MQEMLGVLFVAGLVLGLPAVVLIVIARHQRELRALRERLDRLEQRVAYRSGPELVAPPHPADAAPPPEPLPFAAARTEAPLPDEALPAPSTPAPPAAPAPPLASIAKSPPTLADVAAARSGRAADLEERVGSVWLQNAGAVLVLLGLFFMILWGYTTGRFGPGLLLGAGVLLGLAFAWRGDRVSRSLPRLGHTLIGVGAGITYLSLYLGHFTLRVLPLPVALGLLALTSFATVAAGLRYRVQAIAALGIVGAFLPQLLASWAGQRGFTLPHGALLGYVAVVDLVVFALAARAGWSALDLAALVLTMIAWFGTPPYGGHGWGVAIGLSALFAGLGLAPVPRLLRVEGAVRAVDLAVIAVAPLALGVALSPFIAHQPPRLGAMLLLALAALEFGAAVWVDSRRAERDLWRPLVGAGTVFATAGLGRLVGHEHLALVWCVEGVVLVALGLDPRGAWLRVCGYAVSALAVAVHLGRWSFQRSAGQLPFVGSGALHDLGIVAALATGALLLGRRRERLATAERVMPELWTAAANLISVMWTLEECDRFARALESPGGRWWRGVSLPAPPYGERQTQLFTAAAGFVTFVQAAIVGAWGARERSAVTRAIAYAAGAIAVVVTLSSLVFPDGWSNDQSPVVYPAGLLTAGGIAVAILVASGLGARRGALAFHERYAPEAWTVALTLLLLAWTARESDHVARALAGIPGERGHAIVPPAPNAVTGARTMAAALTSAGWLLQALALLALGWFRKLPFLRWSALALFGATILKFAFWDLRSADVFWRFLTAIAAGAAMLVVSWAYQRRAKRNGP